MLNVFSSKVTTIAPSVVTGSVNVSEHDQYSFIVSTNAQGKLEACSVIGSLTATADTIRQQLEIAVKSGAIKLGEFITMELAVGFDLPTSAITIR